MMVYNRLKAVFTILALIKASTALNFNAPENYRTRAETMSADSCGDGMTDIKDVSVTTDGYPPTFSISDSNGDDVPMFGVFNNELLRCTNRNLLDAAGKSSYTLTVSVSTATATAISFSFELTVTGLDTNPSTPTFDPASLSITTSAHKFDEDGAYFLAGSFTVTDTDPGDAGIVTYSIKDSPPQFELVNSNNTVSIRVTASTLELASPYELVVLATDGGDPPKTGSATATITFDIDDCTPNPCQNNGRCIDAVQNYTCDCSEGYHGTNCTEANSGVILGLGLGVGIPLILVVVGAIIELIY